MAGRSMAWAVAGPAAFAAASVASARRTPGYVVRDRPISSLAAHGSPAASTMVAGFVGLGAATLGLARSLRRSPAAPGPVPAMVAAAGLTTIAAGLARCSDPTCPTRGLGNGTPQRTDDLHALVSGATFALWIATPLVAAHQAAEEAEGYRRAARAIGLTTAAVLVGGGLLARHPDQRGSGWAQRAMVGAALSWPLLAASRS